MSLKITMPGETRTRKVRRPNFNLAGTMKPYGIYPMWATPVLPGETLKSAETKYRLLSMPIKHPFVGATFETWLCYVSLTDLDQALAQMFISEGVPTTGFTAAADKDRFFTKEGQIDYISMAVDRIVQAYFRDDEEPGANTRTIDGVPLARRVAYDWAQNLMFKPDEMDPNYMPSALPAEGTYTPLEMMQMAGMSEITYQKYLAQYGVSGPAAQEAANLPEILRYTRDWTTPTNSVDPSNGRPSSVWAWGSTIKADKPKRFDEPGFVIMMGSIRPKMFDSTFQASMIGELWGFGDFFPVYNLTDPAAGIKVLEKDNAVLALPAAPADDVIYDHRDLLSHGEQFVNDWAGPYSLPTINSRNFNAESYPDQRGYYPSLANINALFVENDEETPRESHRRAYYEGVASVEIVGHVVDTTR